eukprot:TRINITY_DN3785_c0_g1_i1.p1 TRINITY_DN3785_c0_g1~~TRINITY_DN3785_c0_g1_i1.p1  ORF type:complete len:644 (-),score=131.49 TRINITY_DN3785_c0_g1_i1:32-1963(-)
MDARPAAPEGFHSCIPPETEHRRGEVETRRQSMAAAVSAKEQQLAMDDITVARRRQARLPALTAPAGTAAAALEATPKEDFFCSAIGSDGPYDPTVGFGRRRSANGSTGSVAPPKDVGTEATAAQRPSANGSSGGAHPRKEAPVEAAFLSVHDFDVPGAALVAEEAVVVEERRVTEEASPALRPSASTALERALSPKEATPAQPPSASNALESALSPTKAKPARRPSGNVAFDDVVSPKEGKPTRRPSGNVAFDEVVSPKQAKARKSPSESVAADIPASPKDIRSDGASMPLQKAEDASPKARAARRPSASGVAESPVLPKGDSSQEASLPSETPNDASPTDHPAKATISTSPKDGELDEAWEIDPALLTMHEKIGSGITAEVFRATFQEKQVAVKVIQLNKKCMDDREQKAFAREVGIMPHVSHNHLVKFLGIASRQRPFRIITEFCAGGCVFVLLHNCDHIDLSWTQQVKMCRDVASAMDYLHAFQPQIIHRDLKSLNLLLAKMIANTKDVPHVQVSDFGLSRMKEMDSWGKMTKAAGTCHWMAPEVFVSTKYDEKVDVYSYAMILFEIICREIPFEDQEPANVGRLTVRRKRPDLEAVPPDCPTLLRALMISCWEHEAPKRPGFPSIVETLARVKWKDRK